MKKLFACSILFVATIMFSQNTQAQAYKKGDKLLNAGIGLRAYFVPIGGSFEYGITDKISVGPQLYFAKWSSFGGSVTYIGGRGSYHLSEVLKVNNDKLDVYAGGGLGFQNWSYSGLGGSLSSGVYLILHAGGRYYLSDNLGVHAELGSGVSTLLGGITLKF